MENYTNLLKKLIPELVRIFQDSITSIILYGSVARGTQTEESDIDIAVLVNIDHLYWVRDGLTVAEQKIHPHGHGWSLVNNVDQWTWSTDTAAE